MLDHAIRLAGNGFSVFPVFEMQAGRCSCGGRAGCSPGKHPRTQHGCKDATTNLEIIEKWWKKWPKANIGLATGAASGVVVVDVDRDKGGCDTFQSLIDQNGVPETVAAATGGGGIHYYFFCDAAIGNRSGFVSGIDFRGDAGYVLAPPSNHCSGDPYAWIRSPFDATAANIPEWLLKLIKGPKPVDISVATSSPLSPGIDQRAAKYLDSMPPAISGQGGHNALMWAARAMIHGFGLSQDQAYRLLAASYNPRCYPPWSEKELRHKVKEAATKPFDKPHGWLRDDSKDISNFLVDLPHSFYNIDSNYEHDIDDLISDSVPSDGFLRWFFDYYMQSRIKAHPVMAMATAVAIVETITGRKVRSETDLRTNDYNLVIAPTSSGKEGIVNTCRELFSQAGCTEYIIPEEVQSSNGLLTALQAQPAALWLSDEFGKQLGEMLDSHSRGHVKNIAKQLLTIYGRSNSTHGGSAYADGRKLHEIIQPHLSVLGTATSGTVFDAVSSKHISDGLLGRIAFWPVKNRPRRQRVKIANPPQNAINFVKDIHEWVPGIAGNNLLSQFPQPLILNWTDDARNRWEYHSDQIDEKMDHEPESRAGIWGRVAARTMKLAMVHRVSRKGAAPEEGDQMEMDDVNWGVKISNLLARVACSLLDEHVADPMAGLLREKIMAALKKSTASRRDILRKFSAPNNEINITIDAMIERGEIEQIEVKTGGRPKNLLAVK